MVVKKKTLTHSRDKESNVVQKNIKHKKTNMNNDSVPQEKLRSRLKSGIEDDLFICVTDVINKRKSLLNSLKISLLAQEEYEVVHNLRTQKYQQLENLKKEMNQINNLYSKLEKLFPNTKHVISYAEKELNELDHQINLINQSRKLEDRELEELEVAQDEVADTEFSLEEREEEIRESLKKNSSNSHSEKKDSYNANSKLGRIQNNLKIIEQKLKHLD